MLAARRAGGFFSMQKKRRGILLIRKRGIARTAFFRRKKQSKGLLTLFRKQPPLAGSRMMRDGKIWMAFAIERACGGTGQIREGGMHGGTGLRIFPIALQAVLDRYRI